MQGNDFSLLGWVARLLPQATPDGNTPTPFRRRGRFGEDYVLSPIPTKHILSDEGSYFASSNTLGTSYPYNIQSSFSTTTPFMYLFNKASSGGVRIYLDYLKLIVDVAAASGTGVRFATIIDSAPRTFTTDNTSLAGIASPNMDISNGSQLYLKNQNSATASVMTPFSLNARSSGGGSLGGLTVVGDELVITFGADGQVGNPGLTAAQATTPGRKVTNVLPVILGPGHSATFYLWFPNNATTGLTYEFEMGWWER